MRRRQPRDVWQIIELYKAKTGKNEIDTHELAQFALEQGWAAPKPLSPRELLAKQFSRSMRQLSRYDEKTKHSYRAYHAYPAYRNGVQLKLWVDIDEAPRGPMWASLTQRRQQMVDDGYHLSLDADHWNAIHRDEEPIVLQFDFTYDVEWRKNAPEEEDDAG